MKTNYIYLEKGHSLLGWAENFSASLIMHLTKNMRPSKEKSY